MPQTSRYSDTQVEQLLSELISVLETHRTQTDLALIASGNLVTHLINTRIAPARRQAICQAFVEALQASVSHEQAH